MQQAPLNCINWHRIVLDEGHTVKDPNVGHTKACIALRSERRWLCTGTPISTDVADLQGQFMVLGLDPFSNKNFFNAHVKTSFGSGNWR
jgi:SNF2 family DNA or RNA helicase